MVVSPAFCVFALLLQFGQVATHLVELLKNNQANSCSSDGCPLNTGNRLQIYEGIYRAEDLLAAGITNAAMLEQLQLKVNKKIPVDLQDFMVGFTPNLRSEPHIYIEQGYLHKTATVYGPKRMPTSELGVGWVTFQLPYPIYWDGKSDVLFRFAHTNADAANSGSVESRVLSEAADIRSVRAYGSDPDSQMIHAVYQTGNVAAMRLNYSDVSPCIKVSSTQVLIQQVGQKYNVTLTLQEPSDAVSVSVRAISLDPQVVTVSPQTLHLSKSKPSVTLDLLTNSASSAMAMVAFELQSKDPNYDQKLIPTVTVFVNLEDNAGDVWKLLMLAVVAVLLVCVWGKACCLYRSWCRRRQQAEAPLAAHLLENEQQAESQSEPMEVPITQRSPENWPAGTPPEQRLQNVNINYFQCAVCMDRSINCVLTPCGHSVMCDGCAKQVDSCPICRSHITRVVLIKKK